MKLLEEHYLSQLKRDKLSEYIAVTTDWAETNPQLIEWYRQYARTGDESYLQKGIQFIYETDTPDQEKMAAAATALDNYLVEGMTDERERIEFGILVILVIVAVATAVATPLVFLDKKISENLDTFLTGPFDERGKRRRRMRQDHL